MYTEKKIEKSPLQLPDWARNKVIYEVNIRQYTVEGTINAFLPHLSRLKEMGVGILWFMPVFPIAEEKRKGSLGSYYSASDYCAVNPEFGTAEEFKCLVYSAHELGLKVILDWVPNHTGWDHKWIFQHPEFYTKDSLGNITDPLDGNGVPLGWSDVADLNYDNQQMRAEMTEAMIWWITNFDIDGFRQDMALLVPDDFWYYNNQALLNVKSDLFFLAESDNPNLIKQGAFHSIYGWDLHHLMNAMASGQKNIQDLDKWCNKTYKENKTYTELIFISNHDENSWSGSEIERMGEAYKAFAVLANTLPGMPLMYNGQEEPMAKRLSFFDKDLIGFSSYRNAKFYSDLHKVRYNCKALWAKEFEGDMERILIHSDIFAFTRAEGASKAYIIINLNKNMKSVETDIQIGGVDAFTGEQVQINKGSSFKMKPWEFKVIIQN